MAPEALRSVYTNQEATATRERLRERKEPSFFPRRASKKIRYQTGQVGCSKRKGGRGWRK